MTLLHSGLVEARIQPSSNPR